MGGPAAQPIEKAASPAGASVATSPSVAVASVDRNPSISSADMYAGSQDDVTGIAEAGVLSSLCGSDTNATWQYEIPEGVVRPSDNDTLAYMTVQRFPHFRASLGHLAERFALHCLYCRSLSSHPW